MREQAVAQKNAERIAPARVHGGLCPTALCLVHNVVMHERGDVDQLHNDSKIDMSRLDFTGRAAGQESQERTQTLAAASNGVSHVSFDLRIESCRLLDDPSFNFYKMRLN